MKNRLLLIVSQIGLLQMTKQMLDENTIVVVDSEAEVDHFEEFKQKRFILRNPDPFPCLEIDRAYPSINKKKQSYKPYRNKLNKPRR